MVDAGPQSPSITGHIVLLPAATPHRTLRLVTDVDLLLAATIAAVRMNRPPILFEPPASPGRVRPVPEGLRAGHEGHRGCGWDREVDGVGGEAVREFCEAVLVRLALMGRWGPGSKEGRVLDGP